jgi:hypothetical protein
MCESSDKRVLPAPIVDDRFGPKGPDVAASFGSVLTLTYWDLWCLLAAEQKFQGDLNLLRQSLIDKRLENKFFSSFRKDEVEDLITLVEDIATRVKPFGSIQNILQKLTNRIIKKESQKALRNVVEQEGSHPPSEPMLRSPRRLLEQEAFRGMWKQLPVDPTPIAESLLDLFVPPKKHGYFPKGMTFALSRKVEKRIQRELAVKDPAVNIKAYQYGVYRAALTLFHEYPTCDDSYGNMGDLGVEWVKAILTMSPSSVEVAPNIFLKDLLMFFCWENYGLSCSDRIASALKAQLSKDDLNLAAEILNDIKQRAEHGFQNYNADNADKILKHLNLTTPVKHSTKSSHLRLVSPEGSPPCLIEGLNQ